MENLDILISAIKSRKSISFEYNKPEKMQGKRVGNTHAVFVFTSKAGERSTKVHIVQTSGVSDSKDTNPFPDFRMFNIGDLKNISIMESSLPFEPYYEKYNSEWEGYVEAIEKI